MNYFVFQTSKHEDCAIKLRATHELNDYVRAVDYNETSIKCQLSNWAHEQPTSEVDVTFGPVDSRDIRFTIPIATIENNRTGQIHFFARATNKQTGLIEQLFSGRINILVSV